MNNPDVKHRCKVGITKNPDQRIRAYRTANPQCTFSYLIEIPHKIHEKRIIDLLRDIVTVDSEYVHLSPTITQNVIEGYVVDNEL